MQNTRIPLTQRATALLATFRSPSSLVVILKTSSIAIAVLALYYQDLHIIFTDALQNELSSYALAIPFLFAYFIYRKRKMLRATIPTESTNLDRRPTYTSEIAGVLLCLTAFLLFWHGSNTFTPLEYHVVSLPIFIAGLILVVFNAKTLKVLVFPIVFLLLLTPVPLQTVSDAGTLLSLFAAEAIYRILSIFGLPVSLETEYQSPAIVLSKPGSIPYTFAIETACSGVYSLIGFTIFAVFVAYIARVTTWKKATIFLVGFPLIYALNIIRVIIVVLIGYNYGTDTATQAFHLFGGWVLIFLGTLILLPLSEKIWRTQIFTTKTKATCPNCNPNTKHKEPVCSVCGRFLRQINIRISKLDLIKIAALLISVLMILVIQVPVFALTQGPAEILVQSPEGQQQTASRILPQTQNYSCEFIRRDRIFEETYSRDAALEYAYIPENESGRTVWVAIEVGSSKSVWHSWESSMITWPQEQGLTPLAVQLDLRDVELLQNPPIIGRFFAFKQKYLDMNQVVLYWYENAIFKTDATLEQKYVKLSLIAYTSNPEDISNVEANLLSFGLSIANYWQPLKTWSKIALLISGNSSKLIVTTATLLFGIFLLHAVQRRREKNTNNNVYKKLPKLDRLVIDSIHQTERTVMPTLNNIALTYRNTTGETIGEATLSQKLIEAEKIGIIKRDLISKLDEPIQVWKTSVTPPTRNYRLEVTKLKNKLLSAFFRIPRQFSSWKLKLRSNHRT